MAISTTGHSKADADFDGNLAGSIETWVYTEVQSLTTTQCEIQYTFGWDQGSSYSDNQDFYASIDGDVKYDATLLNNKGAGSYKFYETFITYNRPAYGSASVNHEARCQIDGIYNGPTSNTGTQSTDTNVPAKDGVAPGAPPGLTNSSRTSSSLAFTWSDPSMTGLGPGVDDMWIQVATGADMSGLLYNGSVGNVNSFNATGLNKATTYYTRVRAHNSVNWGAFSGIVAASTLATVPDVPGVTSVSNPTTSGFTVAFTTPPDGGSAITGYTIEVSADNFSTIAATVAATSSPKVLTGLLPGVKYKARVRANNAVGSSAYSPASLEIQTLGGVKVWNGSAYINGLVRVWNGTSWVVVVVRKWNGTSWVV